ncbi:MAG: hypothetical protein KGL18_15160 [Burkholderiales bacterium]|nr:hypothetical protein [Burkholderiales bacterium]MDE1929328.1 hypothetical protein [Burkholderiales bacterium]MDE2160585.1 hypothetical protein [Burkholderiales bacterium]MDE2504301.1 hypothetical protein [Burkholderiales bacterium]
MRAPEAAAVRPAPVRAGRGGPRGLARWLAPLLALVLAPMLAQGAAAAPGATLRLGIHNGLLSASPIEVDAMGQSIANQLGRIAGRHVSYEVNYGSPAIARSLLEPGHFDLALTRPGNLTAALLAKGWRLLANGRDPTQGVNFIARACPGKPGQVQLGGATLQMVGVHNPPPETCVAVAEVWKSPAVRFLTAAKGSLVDLVTRRVVAEHGGVAADVLNTDTQTTVPDFMSMMQVAIIGAVSPHVSGQWAQQGGVVVFHQPMPPLAILAAPGLAAETVAALRAGLADPGTAAVMGRALGIAGLDAPDPRPFEVFMRWLHAAAPAGH